MNPLGFTWEIGNYKNPNVVIPPNGPAPAPVPLGCPASTVIYAADITIVKNCAGWVGFGPIPWVNPWGNPLVLAALNRAAAYMAKLTCPGPCKKVASINWVGWECGGGPPLTAVAAVEIEVECVLPKPGDITAFKDACAGLDELPAPIFLGQGWSPPKKKTVAKKKAKKKTKSKRSA
jgi:hypothetical protein